jgi:outer membrane protein OmpA-like peptidoglycan-associated protein
VVAALAGAARAQAPNIDVTLFHPTDTAEGYFGVDGAFTVRHLGFSAGLFAGWAHHPLVLRHADGTIAQNGLVIGSQLGMDVVGSFGVFGRLEFGIDLPFTPFQDTNDAALGLKGGLGATAVGDLRIDVKGLLYGLRLPHENRIGFTLIAGLTVPSGDGGSFLGDGGVTGRPRIVIEWRNRSAGAAINFGAVLRASRQFADLYVGHQLSYGAAGRYHVGAGVELLAELAGLVGIGQPGALKASEIPLEILGGARWNAKLGFQVSLAGGGGLTRGYGTPDGRVILGFRYQSPNEKAPPRDSDGDGVPDREDRCPDAPGPAFNRGCPENIDSDGDGVVDALDRCPRVRGPAANGGCPDPDRDGDGIPDRLDKCPDLKGITARDGCPDDDRDKDGVPNVIDRCPDQYGTAENDGCPDVDSDGDGIIDREDKCPFDAEVFNGVADDDGCPDQPPQMFELGEDRIIFKEQPIFDAHEELDKRSQKMLAGVAKVLSLHPELRKVRVEGHTDNHGSAIENLDRSRARAATVRRFLVERGLLAADRVTAAGFGPDRPIGDNKTESGRAKNRRIEIVFER